MWLEPTSPHYTSPAVLAEEERILTWAIDAQLADPAPSATVDRDGLDVLQADAAAAVAGQDRLWSWSGRPAPARPPCCGPRVDDLRRHGRTVFGVAPTAKAAHVLAAETGMDDRHRGQAAPRVDSAGPAPRPTATGSPWPRPSWWTRPAWSAPRRYIG